MSQELQNIGRYQILSILGQGAMGRVFLAQDPLLKRKVAIKIVQEKAQEASSQAMERFQREAEISARLNHPNIITVYDVGVDEQAGPFLAMEFVEGASLARHMREKQPDHESILKLLIQGAQALHAAGAAGIVHRDVKPENMLVSLDGRLKLMDFGIANQADQTRLTALGTVVGTPSYTAPEVLMGGEPSAATDRYAFAVTAFECFTGQVPFVGDTVGATLLKIVHEPPTMPKDLPHELGEVFEIALAKDPATRYPDLFTLLDALIESANIPPTTKTKLQAAVEGEGTLSGLGSGPIIPPAGGTHPGVTPSQITGDQATMAIRTTPQPVPTHAGEDPLAFLGELEAQPTASNPLGMKPLPTPAAQTTHDALKATGPLAVPIPVPETRHVPPPSPMPAKGGLGKGLWVALAVLLAGGGAAVAIPMMKAKDRLLTVRTDPPGAIVRVDGVELKGSTPLTKMIPPHTSKGVSKVVVTLPGYEPQGGALPSEGPVTLDYVLIPLPAKLSLVTDPPGAKVSIGGELLGETPIEGKVLPEHLFKGKDPKAPILLKVEKEGFGVIYEKYERGKDYKVLTLSPEKPAAKKK